MGDSRSDNGRRAGPSAVPPLAPLHVLPFHRRTSDRQPRINVVSPQRDLGGQRRGGPGLYKLYLAPLGVSGAPLCPRPADPQARFPRRTARRAIPSTGQDGRLAQLLLAISTA